MNFISRCTNDKCGLSVSTALALASALIIVAGCGTRAAKVPEPSPPPPVVVPVPEPVVTPTPKPPPVDVAPTPKPPPPPAVAPVIDPRVKEGIALYDRGDYNGAIRALSRKELMTEGNVDTRIAAYKYMAFSFCLTQRVVLCRQQFDTILRLDPRFTLRPAEASHPLWGPSYRQAKAATEKPPSKR